MSKKAGNYLSLVLKQLEEGGKSPNEISMKTGLAYYSDLYNILRALKVCGLVESVKSPRQCPTCGQVQRGRLYTITEAGREFFASREFPATELHSKARSVEQARIIEATAKNSAAWEET
ncbi:MAG: hypothetical protein ACRDF4_08440 [Rhabdochlamydiaceae bacterium]